MGDFLKNAGIVGLNYMLDMSDAESGKDYGIKMQNGPVDGLELYEQGLWLDEDFVQQCDWTGMYFDACVNYYGDFTVYKGILDRINKIICKIDNDQWKPDKLVKEDKEDIKFINDKLLSNSYKAGFENIRNEVDGSEVYMNLQQNKLNAKSTSQELKQRLEGIKNFIMQPKCKETFVMKSVIYNYINRFWDGKCFLLRANAKKDMRILFEQDFTKPFKEYIRTNHDKDKDMCIDCGRPMGKSSLINALLNEDRAIVSDIAGTTRDAIDTKFKYNHEDITVIDTAGMRKKGKIYESVEKYSLIRSLKAIDRSDVCVLVIDASTGIIEHDKHIASYALDAGKGIVICVNKWDTIIFWFRIRNM